MDNEKYNLILPVDDIGIDWEYISLDRESTLTTLKANIKNKTSVSEKIISLNKDAILNMELSIKEIRVYLTTLSQAKFAKTFHIPLSTFSHWEQEERTPPQYVNWMLKNIVINDFLLNPHF